MDIGLLSMDMAQPSVATAVNVAIMKKSMKTAEETGTAILEMLDGCTVDIRI